VVSHDAYPGLVPRHPVWNF